MARPVKYDPNNPWAGYTRCLGWCNKKFYSYDRRKDRFCTSCRNKKENAQKQLSNIHAMTLDDDR